MFIIKRKLYTLLKDGSGISISDFKKHYDNLGGSEKLGKSFKEWYRGGAPTTQQIGGSSVAQGAVGSAISDVNGVLDQLDKQKQNVRKINKVNGNSIAYNKGQKSVGVIGGIKNTWKKANTLGKVGMGMTGLAAAGTMAYGLNSMLKNKKEN